MAFTKINVQKYQLLNKLKNKKIIHFENKYGILTFKTNIYHAQKKVKNSEKIFISKVSKILNISVNELLKKDDLTKIEGMTL